MKQPKRLGHATDRSWPIVAGDGALPTELLVDIRHPLALALALAQQTTGSSNRQVQKAALNVCNDTCGQARGAALEMRCSALRF
jgi:hypothetical protein